MQTSEMEDRIIDCLDLVAFAQLESSPREQVEAMIPRNKAEAAMKKATLLRYEMENFIAKNPNAADWCEKIFVGTMYALQGVEYAGVAAVSGPIGIASRFAMQETAGHALEHGVEVSCQESAKLITDHPVLRQEFANTIKCTAYAGLCIGSAKASKKLISTLAKNAVASGGVRGIIKESEMIQRALTTQHEWNGQFKLVREIQPTASGHEFSSNVYSR
jgi:hypothetical protein